MHEGAPLPTTRHRAPRAAPTRCGLHQVHAARTTLHHPHAGPLAAAGLPHQHRLLALERGAHAVGLQPHAIRAATPCIRAAPLYMQARTLWGGVINSCRNVVRQSNRATPPSPAPLPLPYPYPYPYPQPHAPSRPCTMPHAPYPYPYPSSARCGRATPSSPTTHATACSSGGDTTPRAAAPSTHSRVAASRTGTGLQPLAPTVAGWRPRPPPSSSRCATSCVARRTTRRCVTSCTSSPRHASSRASRQRDPDPDKIQM